MKEADASDEDARLMAHAIGIAREHMNSGDSEPFGAVVAKDGRIVAKGWNCVADSKDPTAHAELIAIRRACEALGTPTLEGATLYTNAEPCPMCLTAAYWARIGRLVYANTRAEAAEIGFDDGFLYNEMARAPADRALTTTHLPSKTARDVFAAWRAKRGS